MSTRGLHKGGSAILPTTQRPKNVGQPAAGENAVRRRQKNLGQPVAGENANCDDDPCEKVPMAPLPRNDSCYDVSKIECCKIAAKTLLSNEEYAEWRTLYLASCKKESFDECRLRELSRRLHLWRDGFTSDSTYQIWRAKAFDRWKMMGAAAAGLSEFVGTFIWTIMPVLIIAAVPEGQFDQWGLFGVFAFFISAIVASTFTYLFMHGSYFEPTTALLLFWFSDKFTNRRQRNGWEVFARILAMTAAAFIGVALLLAIWHPGSPRFERVAQIVDIPTFVTSPDTNNDAVAGPQNYTVGESLLVVVLCALIFELASFAIHVVSHSTIRDYGSFNLVVPFLVGLAVLLAVWGQWNVTRSATGPLKWLVTNAVLVGHWAYGLSDSMQVSGWVIPVGFLIAHVLAVIIIMVLKWLFSSSGMIPKGYSYVRTATRTRTSNDKNTDDESSDGDNSSGTDDE